MARTGRPKGSGVIPVEARFWPKVARRSYSECWLWTAATNHENGSKWRYGVIGVPPGWGGLDTTKYTMQQAHRVAFFLVHGRWPEPFGLHGCDVPLCCNAENPEHVHEGTAADNTREMLERGRAFAPPVLLGERAGPSRLTDFQALEILERYQHGGIRQVDLAAEYGVSQVAISYIVRGKRRFSQ